MAKTNLFAGILAGVAGGLAASWMMNQFQAGPGVALAHAVQTDEENAAQQKAAKEHAGEPQEDATMKTAKALTLLATGKKLTFAEEETGGPIVHYVFGALMGGIYGGLAEYSDAAKSGMGSTFGTVLFAGADLVGVPVLGLSGAPTSYPVSSYASPFAAHLVYGVTTEVVRRLVRAIV